MRFFCLFSSRIRKVICSKSICKNTHKKSWVRGDWGSENNASTAIQPKKSPRCSNLGSRRGFFAYFEAASDMRFAQIQFTKNAQKIMIAWWLGAREKGFYHRFFKSTQKLKKMYFLQNAKKTRLFWIWKVAFRNICGSPKPKFITRLLLNSISTFS